MAEVRGFEPQFSGSEPDVLPIGRHPSIFWSGRPGSNWRPPGPRPGATTAELLPDNYSKPETSGIVFEISFLSRIS